MTVIILYLIISYIVGTGIIIPLSYPNTIGRMGLFLLSPVVVPLLIGVSIGYFMEESK